MGWFFTKAVNRNWQPLEDAFRAKAERSLPGAALSNAMSDFEHALDATRVEQMNKRNERLAQYFAANMSEESLKAAAEFYASALGQKMVLSPDTVSPEDRREQGRLMLANPALTQASIVQLRFAASDHANVEKARLEFAHDFQARLCAAFQRDRISAKLCSPENTIKGG